MKTKIILFALVSLSLTAVSAIAASASDETDPIEVLPAYTVEAPRQTSLEKEVSQSLDALRAIAAQPIRIKVALPLPEIKNTHVQTEPKSSPPAIVVAGV